MHQPQKLDEVCEAAATALFLSALGYPFRNGQQPKERLFTLAHVLTAGQNKKAVQLGTRKISSSTSDGCQTHPKCCDLIRRKSRLLVGWVNNSECPVRVGGVGHPI